MSDAGNSADGLAAMSTDELRAAVRAVLRDVLPAAVLDTARTSTPAAVGDEVVLGSDADLDVFVRRLAALCADPGRRAALQEGRHTFRLAMANGSAGAAAVQAVEPARGVLRVDRGAVTERTVRRAAADGVRLVLGRGAVLTPLARDKARSLGVAVEKES
jgi:hypothetical protein